MKDETTHLSEGTELITQPTTVELISSAEINQQVTTAHRFPRSMAVFRRRALEMVTLDEETAESCIYRRPVGKKRNEETGKWEESYAEGMSIRMAEIVGASYGNLRVGAMLIAQDERQVRARGFAHSPAPSLPRSLSPPPSPSSATPPLSASRRPPRGPSSRRPLPAAAASSAGGWFRPCSRNRPGR
jgi:hypothetical protein